jgi:hypothetical protein
MADPGASRQPPDGGCRITPARPRARLVRCPTQLYRADIPERTRRKNNDALDKIDDGYEALAQLVELSADQRRLLSAHTINEIFWYNRTAEDRLVGFAAADPTKAQEASKDRVMAFPTRAVPLPTLPSVNFP